MTSMIETESRREKKMLILKYEYGVIYREKQQ